ncbi:hypothetical protein BKH41_02830 [Helicobacter sp. 12S02232-10]|uniref:hypothetical protein n=1 Tax=Helicobacter sp. 12S02232-10 TaxID=1476197 RepID=UPI000BA685DE|nr:hypothetical protein [Helicobacter sp. 12S02232-10]PAF49615.1 hypothetical protein BKH41_02830 [Helicobacter sp. 12S02232-10]
MWAKEQAYLSKDKNSVPLAHELEDLEEILIASCFVLSQKMNGGGMSLWSEIDYLIVKDFSKKYDLDSIEVYGVLKEMNAEMERIRGE